MPTVIAEQKKFPTVDNTDGVLTEEFLEAASGAAEIVKSMGSQFSMTRDDMLGNITKVRTKFDTDREKFRQLKDLLQDEKDKKEDKNDKSGTVGALWLKRGLEYLCEVFWELITEHEASKQPGGKSDSGAVKVACSNAYKKTLTKHHNMATRMIVKGALMVSPYKETLMTNLAKGEKGKDDEVTDDLKAYEPPLRAFVIIAGKLFNDFGHKDDCIESH
ncbi:pleckstrin homology domain-containing family A member 8-like [Mya arenaria]|uniref:pleckstrin homology domain-containing family A member 8-like n=1 Tax=Mya arenaria TaxID=6604 RepID=UPI0022E29D2F|nr:pleckstrin homology domain-containing family A member 8-like [Mya arenaria]